MKDTNKTEKEAGRIQKRAQECKGVTRRLVLVSFVNKVV